MVGINAICEVPYVKSKFTKNYMKKYCINCYFWEKEKGSVYGDCLNGDVSRRYKQMMNFKRLGNRTKDSGYCNKWKACEFVDAVNIGLGLQ